LGILQSKASSAVRLATPGWCSAGTQPPSIAFFAALYN
jgi:hypothetical protein